MPDSTPQPDSLAPQGVTGDMPSTDLEALYTAKVDAWLAALERRPGAEEDQPAI